MDKSKKLEESSDWADKSGTKYFKTPFGDLFKKSKNKQYWEKKLNTGDDRSQIIFVNLVIENYIDILLKHIILDYDTVLKKSLTYYLKIKLLESFSMIPAEIIDTVQMLKQIRNDFAHNLEIDKFEDLAKKRKDQIEEFSKRIPFLFADILKKDIELKINQLEFFALQGLDLYEVNFRTFKEVITSEEFKKSLLKRNQILIGTQLRELGLA